MRPLPLLFLPLIYSFSFSPMSQSIELANKQKTAQFLIANDSDQKVAIELTVKERIMNKEGKEELPSTKEVSVFPPQMIIPPKEKRTIRVSWNGGTNPKLEKAYRVIAEQLPLKLDDKAKKQSGIQMLMRYMAAFYVTPEGAAPKLEIKSFEVKNKQLEIEITNLGNKHQILMDPVLTFSTDKKKVSLNSQELIGFSGENVLAGSSRIFKIKLIKDIPIGGQASLKIND